MLMKQLHQTQLNIFHLDVTLAR